MTDQAIVGIVAIIATILLAAVGWATYVAWMLSAMNSTLHQLRDDHAKLSRAIDELYKISQLHETRLVRLEAHEQHREK